MSSKLLQVLVVVDVQGSVDPGELEALLPDRRDDRRSFSLRRDGGAPAVVRQGPDAHPIDWPRLGRAVELVAAKVREASEGRTLVLYAGGQGPLVVFAHLGYAVSKFNGEQWMIARREPGAPLELFRLSGGAAAPRLLVPRRLPAEPSPASGQVAIYVDVMQRGSDVKFRDAIAGAGGHLAGVVELTPDEPLTVAPENAAQLAAELGFELSRLAGLYPHAAPGLFIGGPIALAFAVGRAVNPTVVPAVTLYDHDRGAYQAAYSLPFQDRSEPALPTDAASIAARAAVEAALAAAILAMQSEIAEEDLAGALPDVRERRPFLHRLRALRYVGSTQSELSLSLTHGTFSFGAGLLEALRGGESEQQGRFARLLLLHELIHEHQGIRSTNYHDVGRAGVVLESIDFSADVLALRIATSSALRRLLGPAPAAGAVAAEVTRWLDAVLYGIQAFDRWQHGARIAELAERRLRRYLTWHLQRVRGETIESATHVESLLDTTVTVELAPVRARLDHRFDRLVLDATPSTELFAAVGGRLIRHGARPGFDPGALVEAVRRYDAAAIQAAMRFIVAEHRPLLVPWRP